MRLKTRAAAMWLGISAGMAGLEHGVFELLQGNTRPEGVMIIPLRQHSSEQLKYLKPENLG